MVQWCAVMVSLHTLGPLIPINHCLNATVYLNIDADYVHPFMATMHSSSNGYFQHDNALCHNAKVCLEAGFLNMTMSSMFLSGLFSLNPTPLGCGKTGDLLYEWAACSIVVKLLDLDLQGRWFDPWCGHTKICTAVGPLSKALNPTLLQGVFLLLSLMNCKSLWIKVSAKSHVM